MKTNPTRALAIAAGLVIVALTAAAFWLSYAHLAEVALAHGMKGKEVRAWAWPATLDLFIVAGELLMLRAALNQRVDWWAIGLTVAGSGGSIALNVAGVGGSAQPLDYVVAAVPPTAALLAFGALMRQVHQALAGHVEPSEVTTVDQGEVTVADDGLDAFRPRPAVEPVPAGVRLLPTFECPGELARATNADALRRVTAEESEAGAEPSTEVTSTQYRIDHFAERYVPVEVPTVDEQQRAIEPRAEVVIPGGADVDLWAPEPPHETTNGQLLAKAASVPAETPRKVVTESVTLTPSDLRREARKLNRQALADTSRPVTIDTLRAELNLSRREATELRREIVGARS